MLAQLADNASSDLRELALLANHKSVGITILALAIIRVGWRIGHPPPPLPASMPAWQVTASHVSHWALYALLFLMPVSGWLMSSATAYSVSWFNLFQLPDLVAPDPQRAELFEEIHEFLAYTLGAVASLHVLAALKHHFLDKDTVLSRMITASSFAGFVVIAVVGGAWLGGMGERSAPAASRSPETSGANDAGALDVSSGLPAWQIDYATSYIRFTGDQAGASFEGTWEAWQATLQFSVDDLGASAFDVTIDTSSANTQDTDRDATLSDPEWFDALTYPEATFRTKRFTTTDDGYAASAELVIKNVVSPVELVFAVEREGNRRALTGTANLDRLALGVGTGEWADTDWIGQYVTVEVLVNATVSQ